MYELKGREVKWERNKKGRGSDQICVFGDAHRSAPGAGAQHGAYKEIWAVSSLADFFLGSSVIV